MRKSRCASQEFCFSPAEGLRFESPRDSGNYWTGRTHLYGRKGLSLPNIVELDGEKALYLRLAKAGIVPFSLPFDKGAAVVRLVFLAPLAGYQKIVLAGVDLRDSRFFWEA